MIARLVLAALLLWCSLAAAFAAPSRIIILRHGEKEDAWRLCGVGEQRAQALAANYLGRNAANSLFAGGEKPAAFLAITLHTLELARLRRNLVAAAYALRRAAWRRQEDVREDGQPADTRGRGRPHVESLHGRARPW